jgi:MFS family permease
MALLIPTAFVGCLAMGIINLAMLFIVKERFHAGPQAVGVFTALSSVAYFLGCIVLKRFSDRIGPRAAMSIMTLGTAALFALFLVVPSMPLAFIVYFLYGLLTALFWPPMMTWLSSGLEGQALSKATNTFSLSWSSGGAIAPYVAGLLCELGLEIPVYVGIAIFALAGLVMASSGRLVPSPAVAAPGPDSRCPTPVEDHSTPLRFPAWIGAFMIYAVLAVFSNIFPLFAKDELSLSESRIGLLLLVRASFAALGFWALGRFGFWHFRKRYIALGVLSLLLLDLAFVFVHAPAGFAVGLAALGLVQALCYNSSIFYGASGAADRARRMTIHEALLTAGQILGSIGGGMAYQAFSWQTVFVFLAVIVAGGLVAQLILLGRKA